MLPLTIGLDHRFIDGYQAATMARVFRAYVADPAAFDPLPTSIPPPKRQRALDIPQNRGGMDYEE